MAEDHPGDATYVSRQQCIVEVAAHVLVVCLVRQAWTDGLVLIGSPG